MVGGNGPLRIDSSNGFLKEGSSTGIVAATTIGVTIILIAAAVGLSRALPVSMSFPKADKFACCSSVNFTPPE